MTNIHELSFNSGLGPLMLPVIPPNAIISQNSKVRDVGKTPGQRSSNGEWYGVDLRVTSCADLKTAQKRDRWGASLGLACGRDGLFAVDIDVNDELALEIETLATSTLGQTAVRCVDEPGYMRRILAYRLLDDVTGEGVDAGNTNIDFDMPDGSKAAVQILGNGKQFVAYGIHPRTNRPYVWTYMQPSTDGTAAFTETNEDALKGFLVELDNLLKAKGCSVTTHKHVQPKARMSKFARNTGTETEVRAWMGLIPNDDAFSDYDDWVQMAYALWGAADGAAWGREIWLEWCAQQAQNPGADELVWDKLDRTEVRTGLERIRTWARERNPGRAAILDFTHAPIPDDDELEEMVKSAQTHALWPSLLRRYVYVGEQDVFYDVLKARQFSSTALDVLHANLVPALRAELGLGPKDGGPKTFVKLLTSSGDFRKADAFTYWPGVSPVVQDEKGALLLNRWSPGFRSVRPNVTDADIQTYLDFCTYVWGDKQTADTFLKWCAFNAQFPDRKANWHPLLCTQPGVGKDTMMIPIRLLFGADNYRVIDMGVLSSDWTDFVESKLVQVSESKQRNGRGKSAHDVYNDLKTYLAQPPEMVPVIKKYARPYYIPNLSVWIFFTNEDNPFYVDSGDRRLWIVDNRGAVKKDEKFYSGMNHWLKQHSPLVASYLLEYPLTDADMSLMQGPAPATDAKAELAELNRNPVEAALTDLLTEARLGGMFPTPIVTTQDIQAALRDATNGKIDPSSRMISRYLKQKGAHPIVADTAQPGSAAPVRCPDGKVRRLWKLWDRDREGNDLSGVTPKHAAEIYVAAKWVDHTPSADVIPLVKPVV